MAAARNMRALILVEKMGSRMLTLTAAKRKVTMRERDAIEVIEVVVRSKYVDADVIEERHKMKPECLP